MDYGDEELEQKVWLSWWLGVWVDGTVRKRTFGREEGGLLVLKHKHELVGVEVGCYTYQIVQSFSRDTPFKPHALLRPSAIHEFVDSSPVIHPSTKLPLPTYFVTLSAQQPQTIKQAQFT